APWQRRAAGGARSPAGRALPGPAARRAPPRDRGRRRARTAGGPAAPPARCRRLRAPPQRCPRGPRREAFLRSGALSPVPSPSADSLPAALPFSPFSVRRAPLSSMTIWRRSAWGQKCLCDGTLGVVSRRGAAELLRFLFGVHGFCGKARFVLVSCC